MYPGLFGQRPPEDFRVCVGSVLSDLGWGGGKETRVPVQVSVGGRTPASHAVGG